MHILKFLPLSSLTIICHNLGPLAEHFHCTRRNAECKPRLASSRALNIQLPLNPRDIDTWLLTITAKNPTFRRYRVYCAQGSSNIPERRTSSVPNIENNSIVRMTLKLCLGINFSTWTGFKLKGYCTPAFRVGSPSRALIKSLSAPPQQTIVGPIGTTLSNWPTIHTLPFTTETYLLQRLSAIITRFPPP